MKYYFPPFVFIFCEFINMSISFLIYINHSRIPTNYKRGRKLRNKNRDHVTSKRKRTPKQISLIV